MSAPIKKDPRSVHLQDPGALAKAPVETWEPNFDTRLISARQRPKLAPLTIRSVGEILSTELVLPEPILEVGYLTPGERLSILGQGGIGKSRVVQQLAFCCAAGVPFLDWETRGANKKWLFFQTENSVRRLKHDVEKMLQAFDKEQRVKIESNVHFHTLEQDADGMIYLDLPEHRERVEQAIAEIQPHIVVFDPLRDCGLGNLNEDRDMSEVLRVISEVVRQGNPLRIPLIIHHATTGKAGAAKATGYDRASFGRNSKVLHGWVRAQFNIAPAGPDDNNLLILASGKHSNGEEFKPFAIRLNQETMMYTPDWGFSVEDWMESLSNPSRSGTERVTPELVRELLPLSGSVEKAAVIRQIRDKTKAGEKHVKARLNELTHSTNGPLYEWKIKRSGKRDEVHLARFPQPA